MAVVANIIILVLVGCVNMAVDVFGCVRSLYGIRIKKYE